MGKTLCQRRAVMIVDFSRRTDPACEAGYERFKRQLAKHGEPNVLHFWTKNPLKLADLYGDAIDQLQQVGTTVCAQVTINGYQPPVEQLGLGDRYMSTLLLLLEPAQIRLRFDPIIFGYTTQTHFKTCLYTAICHGISRITVNFLIPKYQGVGKLLSQYNIPVEEGSLQRKVDTLGWIREQTPLEIEIAVCAETSELYLQVPGVVKAACADPEWFKSLGADLSQENGYNSRKGCGCFYNADWGQYPNQGGYVCPHKCLYCYAKHNVYAHKNVVTQEQLL